MDRPRATRTVLRSPGITDTTGVPEPTPRDGKERAVTAADAAAADTDAAADEGLWPPQPAGPLERLTVWLTPEGEPTVLEDSALGPGSYVIASTTGSID